MSGAQPAVLITGAGGALGGAVVAHFAQRGARLVLLERDGTALRRQWGAGSGAQIVEADLLNREQVAAQLAGAGPIDVLCHLAGGFHMGEPVHATPAAAWDLMMDLNARSLIHVAAAGALKGGASMGAYAASKSALMRLTESMSAELRDAGINVNGVLPSTLDTPANRAAMPDADASRWVAPEALAEVIGFLASDAARAVHGALIPVLGRV